MTTSGFYPITLVSKSKEYDTVYTLKFSSAAPVSFVPGQYVHLLAPASPPGPQNVRHLSIASIPEEGDLQFSLDLSPTSEYKQKLADLAPGGLAHLFKVKGEFVLDVPPASRVVFLAGGLGITPVRALITQIVHRDLAVEWRLAHVARGPYLYQKELEPLGGEQVRLRRPDLESRVVQWVNQWPDARYYASGSSRFVEGMVTLLKSNGVPYSFIRVEDFR